MRFRKRHAWGAILIALFALPVLRPDGFPVVEDPVAGVVTWSARTPALNPNLWQRRVGVDPNGDARVLELENELATLWEEHLRLVHRVSEAEGLKGALEESGLDRLPRVAVARVLMARDAVPSRRSITIDRGADDGVEVWHPVVRGRVYLGRVRVVRARSAIVQLVTDPKSRLEVFVRTDKGELLRGYARSAGERHGLDVMEIEFLHLTDGSGEVVVGTPVFTGNFDVRVPAHLLVGRVMEVSDPDLDRTPKLLMRPALDSDHLTDVVVLLTEGR